jgi:hypothetical protein
MTVFTSASPLYTCTWLTTLQTKAHLTCRQQLLLLSVVLALAAGLNTKPDPHAKRVTFAGSGLVSPQVGVKGGVVGTCATQAGQGQHSARLNGGWC